MRDLDRAAKVIYSRSARTLAAISAIAGVITTFIATSPALWGSDINSLKEDIQELQNENAGLSKQITELRNQNSELSKTIEEQNKTVQNY